MWCCNVVAKYPDLIPFETFGTFKESADQKQWEKKNCNVLVGGSIKNRCPTKITQEKVSFDSFEE